MSLATPTVGVRCPPRTGRTRAWRPLLDERRGGARDGAPRAGVSRAGVSRAGVSGAGVSRAGIAEARALLSHPVWRGAAVPRGDGLPVLLIPETRESASEKLSLTLLSRWLGRMGYVSYRSKVRLEADRPQRVVDRLERRLRLVAELAQRPVALVGQGRGGQLAKALATRRPDLVAGVISLGSPHLAGPELEAPFPLEVPFTSIYSRSDGVVDWRFCLDPAAERVEVESSHVGMAVHPAVYRVLARRLAVMGRPNR